MFTHFHDLNPHIAHSEQEETGSSVCTDKIYINLRKTISCLLKPLGKVLLAPGSLKNDPKPPQTPGVTFLCALQTVCCLYRVTSARSGVRTQGNVSGEERAAFDKERHTEVKRASQGYSRELVAKPRNDASPSELSLPLPSPPGHSLKADSFLVKSV